MRILDGCFKVSVLIKDNNVIKTIYEISLSNSALSMRYRGF